MIKITGLIFIIASFSMGGFNFASKLEKRLEQLKLIEKMLCEIRIYLEYAVMTKDAIFSKIFNNRQYSCLKEDNLNLLFIDKEEKNNLSDFYNQLGTTDLQGQLNAIEMYKKIFLENYEELKAIKDNKCRLMRTSGVLLGVFFCLMLI